MKRTHAITAIVGACLLALIWWVAANTYWADTTVPMPLKGEALVNPFYAAQRFAEALGASTTRDRVLTVPPRDAVVVLSSWHWDLSTSRREVLERWVESGGRLVVDRTLVGGDADFERWSGIARDYPELDDAREIAEEEEADPCRTLQEWQDATAAATNYRICDFDNWSFLTSVRPLAWALRDTSRTQAMRVQIGRGSVTVINGTPFLYRNLFDGDHGRLFVAATQLRRGDEVHFLSEDDHPSLLALLWRHAGPVVVLALALVSLLLWRGGVRFGPLSTAPIPARRSLADQIRGTGAFALRHGSGESLHAAVVRALDAEARRRVQGYAHLPATERSAALARLTGLDAGVLASAIHNPGLRRPQQLRSTIALLETARRSIALDHGRSRHGTR